MNEAKQRQLFREILLIQLHETRLPTAGRTLQLGAKVSGHNVTEQQVDDELRYLEGKGLVTVHRNRLSRGQKTYELTSDGVDYLEEEGLV